MSQCGGREKAFATISRNYFAQLPCPTVVIMSGEAFPGSLWEADLSLIESGAENRVILSTPPH